VADVMQSQGRVNRGRVEAVGYVLGNVPNVRQVHVPVQPVCLLADKCACVGGEAPSCSNVGICVVLLEGRLLFGIFINSAWCAGCKMHAM